MHGGWPHRCCRCCCSPAACTPHMQAGTNMAVATPKHPTYDINQVRMDVMLRLPVVLRAINSFLNRVSCVTGRRGSSAVQARLQARNATVKVHLPCGCCIHFATRQLWHTHSVARLSRWRPCALEARCSSWSMPHQCAVHGRLHSTPAGHQGSFRRRFWRQGRCHDLGHVSQLPATSHHYQLMPCSCSTQPF